MGRLPLFLVTFGAALAKTYYFLCPDISGASGGIAVLYDAVALLSDAGHQAAVVHMGPSGYYANTPHDFSAFYTTKIRDVQRKRMGRLKKLTSRFSGGSGSGGRRNAPLDLKPDDVLVVPEFFLADTVEAFPNQPKIVFVQNSFAYLRTYADAIKRGLDPQTGVIWSIGISDTCMRALELVEAKPVSRVPVAPNLTLFPFAETKKRKVCYMPRKRPDEALVIDRALRDRGNLDGFELVEIEGMPQAEVARHLSESLFFISLMRTEALGFPGMEAMSAGCVVIGYTGLGTEEYFDTSTGIPVAEGDTVAVVEAVEAAIAAYSRNPGHFDEMRKTASDRIRTRYSQDMFKTSLLAAWGDIVE